MIQHSNIKVGAIIVDDVQENPALVRSVSILMGFVPDLLHSRCMHAVLFGFY